MSKDNKLRPSSITKSRTGLEKAPILSLWKTILLSVSTIITCSCSCRNIADLPSYIRMMYCVNTTWHIISSKQKANHVFPWGRLSRYSRLRLWHRDRSVLFSAVPSGSVPTSSPGSSVLPGACVSRTVTHILQLIMPTFTSPRPGVVGNGGRCILCGHPGVAGI